MIRLSKSHRSLCVSFSRRDVGFCIYCLFVWSNFNFLDISPWITLLTQSCLVLYSFCANLLHYYYYYYYYYYFTSLRVFPHQRQLMVFHRSLSDSKSLEVSGTLFSILADLNGGVVWMVSTCVFIFNYLSPFINPLLSVTRAPITFGIDCHFHVPLLFQFSSKVQVLISLFTFFQFYSEVN